MSRLGGSKRLYGLSKLVAYGIAVYLAVKRKNGHYPDDWFDVFLHQTFHTRELGELMGYVTSSQFRSAMRGLLRGVLGHDVATRLLPNRPQLYSALIPTFISKWTDYVGDMLGLMMLGVKQAEAAPLRNDENMTYAIELLTALVFGTLSFLLKSARTVRSARSVADFVRGLLRDAKRGDTTQELLVKVQRRVQAEGDPT